MSVTPAERRQFQEEGWVMKPGVLDDAGLEPIRRGLHAAVDREAERARQEGLVDETFPAAPFDRRLALLAERFPDQVPRIMAPVNSGRFAGPELFHTITHPRLLDVVQGFLGERIIGSSVYRVRPKLPRWERGEVPWHQDSGYFLPHCDDLLVLTCWIPLIDVSVDNGCLWVVPRSHRNGVYRHYTGRPRRLSRDPRPGARRRSHPRGDEVRRRPLPHQSHRPRLLREPQRPRCGGASTCATRAPRRRTTWGRPPPPARPRGTP